MDKIILEATLNKVAMDKDGEMKIEFIVPLSSRVEVLKLMETTEKELQIEIIEISGKLIGR